MLKGIDVSGYQGTIDWAKAKNNGVQFAILKLGNIYDTDTNSLDSKFETNYSKCIELGIPVGVYVYNYCNGLNALKKGVEWAIKKLNGRALNLPIYLDMEDKTITVEGKTALTQQCIEFCKMIKQAGYQAGVYANVTWFKNYIDASKLDCSIWVAQYYTKCEYKGKYDIWQYTSSGTVSGINSKNIDMNYLYNENIINKTETKPVPTPTPKNTNVLEWQKVMNKCYNCGLAEDNSYGPDSKSKADKYYLYYKKPTIKNDHVKFIQQQLCRHGYKVDIDGSFGPDCKKKVKQFQKDHGLTVDGNVGPMTTELLLK